MRFRIKSTGASNSVDYEFSKRLYAFNEAQKKEAELQERMKHLPQEREYDSLTAEYLNVIK